MVSSINNAKRRSLIAPTVFTLVFAAVNVGSTMFFSRALENISTTTARSSTEASHGDIVVIAVKSLQDEIDKIVQSYISEGENINWEAFKANLYYDNVDRSARQLFLDTEIIKIKVFSDDGTTIYSSDPSQVGKQEDGIEEITHALRGRSTSQMETRESFIGLAGEQRNVSITSSYHPLKARNGDVVGVVEVYSDRTAEVQAYEDFALSQLGSFLIFIGFNAASWFGLLLFYAMRRRETD